MLQTAGVLRDRIGMESGGHSLRGVRPRVNRLEGRKVQGKVREEEGWVYLAGLRVSGCVQPYIVDVRVCEVVSGGGEANVDLSG